MSRTNRNIGIVLAVGCGVLVSYSTLRPELEKQKAERLGLPLDRKDYDTVLSGQMRDDFREAGRELRNEGGFAWGIRQKLFGRNPNVVVAKEGGDRERKQEVGGEAKTEERKG